MESNNIEKNILFFSFFFYQKEHTHAHPQEKN